jgi:hypothetical protein
MQRLWAGLIMPALMLAIPTVAGNRPSKADESEKAANGPARPATASSAIETELRQLREEMEAQRSMLDKQQARIEALEAELRLTRRGADSPAAGAKEGLGTAAPQASQDQIVQRVANVEKEIEGTKKSFEERLKKIGPFSFSGEFRLRNEPFFGGPTDQSQARNRFRFKLRVDGDARLNDEISGGFSLTTGDLNNPISTNQTANQFYTRKPFDLDRAFINYTPHFLEPLTLTGGKFAYPWYRTELAWDNDLNPEGLAQTLAWNRESARGLKRFALVGFELPFAEVAGVALQKKSIVQSVVYGGQLQTEWHWTDWLKFSAYAGFYNWHNPDPVALAVETANAASPELGLLKLNSNGTENSTITTTGSFTATGQTVITDAQFASKFGIFDTIARLDIKTRAERWPLMILGNYAQNTRACANVGNIRPAPANTPTETFSQSTNAPCDPRQRRGYWLEARLGRTQEKGDWDFSYTRIFVEREAVLGVFNYSEMRQGTNVTQHRVEMFYQAYRNIQLGFTGLFGRPLVTASSPAPAENILKRLQFDVTYKF